MSNLTEVMSKDLSYCAPALKKRFHLLAQRALSNIANELGLELGSYTLRSYKGGIGVSGEISLRTDTLYIMVFQSMGQSTVLYRTCKGREDYVGGPNHYALIEQLEQPVEFVRFLRGLS